MQELTFRLAAAGTRGGRAHVGVVASGDLEVLMEPSRDGALHVRIRTSVGGYAAIWEATLERFRDRNQSALTVDINDFGATPGMVLLRLQQALDAMELAHD